MKCVHDIISLGAGIQSTTILLMAKHGETKHKPQCAIFSDTMCESKKVYEHLEWLKEYTKNDIPIITVSAGNLMHDALHTNNRFASMPLFVKGLDGKVAMLKRQCTNEYKIEVIKREIRKIIGNQYWRHHVRQWMGISLDETIRMKINKTKYLENYYPLVQEKTMSRIDCISWLLSNGYKVPPKSACIICPFHSDEYWQNLKDNEPDDFEDACIFDEAIRKSMTRFKIKTDVYLHRSLKPLRSIDFLKGYTSNLFYNLECSGNCFL